jgi:hypothetical protein
VAETRNKKPHSYQQNAERGGGIPGYLSGFSPSVRLQSVSYIICLAH